MQFPAQGGTCNVGNDNYCFSETGNSFVVAKAVAAKLGGAKLVHIAHPDAKKPIGDSQRVGLVFPVYVWGLPPIVTRFIKKLQNPSDAYCFAVAVNGGMPCATLKQTANLFSEHGMDLSSGFAVTMVDNYTPLSNTIPLEKQKIRFEKADRAIDEICGAIEKRLRSIHAGWPMVNWLFSKIYRGWVVKG